MIRPGTLLHVTCSTNLWPFSSQSMWHVGFLKVGDVCCVLSHDDMNCYTFIVSSGVCPRIGWAQTAAMVTL